jgi:hypothetical protein
VPVASRTMVSQTWRRHSAADTRPCHKAESISTNECHILVINAWSESFRPLRLTYPTQALSLAKRTAPIYRGAP